VALHWQAAALLRPVEPEGSDDEPSAGRHARVRALYVSPAVSLAGEEVEDGPVVPQLVGALVAGRP
jgi:hypothetical protein